MSKEKKKKKKTIPQFATMVSGGDIDILERIFTNQYEELLYVFYCLKDDIDAIKNIDYDIASNPYEHTSSLSESSDLFIVTGLSTNKDAEKLHKRLLDEAVRNSSSYKLEITREKNTLSIIVRMNLEE